MVDRLSATDNLLDAYIELIEIAENVQDVDVRDNDSECKSALELLRSKTKSLLMYLNYCFDIRKDKIRI